MYMLQIEEQKKEAKIQVNTIETSTQNQNQNIQTKQNFSHLNKFTKKNNNNMKQKLSILDTQHI
ncbi:hypothetical protein DERF_015986 [Dermatophagoides farinae]|uniref:Uncharacterized protein n=1 Tax=Dermatophagoides farinae TaxID=6954 RepID=A0A922HFY5_DERFA|nr:hypothetical protein DERF_015986 [Dermatophagoides farinae]